MAAILKVSRQIDNLTPSVDAYLLEEHNCYQISYSRSGLKQRSLIGFFEEVAPTRTKHEEQEQEQQDV